MLGESPIELNHQRYLDEARAEMAHWEHVFEAERTSKSESDGSAGATLDGVAPKLRYAREKFDELLDANGDEWMLRLAYYKEARNDLRDTFKRLDHQNDLGGPPLD